TAERIDREVKRLIDAVRAETRALLEEKRDLLETLAQALLTKEVLNENDLLDVLGPRPYPRHDYHEGMPVDAEGEPVNDPSDNLQAPVAEAPSAGGDGALGAQADPLQADDGQAA